MKGISKLALAWDSNIRQEVLEKAAKELSGNDKQEASKLSKAILEDLKYLDKLAKSNDKASIANASVALQGHVLQFVKLEPQ